MFSPEIFPLNIEILEAIDDTSILEPFRGSHKPALHHSKLTTTGFFFFEKKIFFMTIYVVANADLY